MQDGDNTVESLEMAAVKTCNHTQAVDDVDWFVSQIDCRGQLQVMNYFPWILSFLHGIAACHNGHAAEEHLLAAVEICLSTCSLHKDGCKLL